MGSPTAGGGRQEGVELKKLISLSTFWMLRRVHYSAHNDYTLMKALAICPLTLHGMKRKLTILSGYKDKKQDGGRPPNEKCYLQTDLRNPPRQLVYHS